MSVSTNLRIAVWAAALAIASSAFPASSWAEDDWRHLNSRLAELVDENEIVGVAVGVVADSEITFSRGYGSSRLNSGNAITDRSVFHWASVSKPFVSVAIMQLVESGELSIDDLLVDRLPWFAMADDRHREITIAQLLSHTSGMPDVDDYEWDRPQTDSAALKRWILELEDKSLLFAPGTSRDYSNIGFEILGLVIQEVSGTSFEDYMQSNIFDLLEMTDTSFIASEIDPALRVTGHFDSASRRAIAAYPYNRRHAPSSTLNTNITDMSKFAIALLNGGKTGDVRLLKPDTIETMWTAAWQSPEDPSRTAALGWNIGRPWGGILAASHGGHDDGFRSYLFLAPEERVGIFLVSNDETISTRDFVRAILEAVFPEQALSETVR